MSVRNSLLVLTFAAFGLPAAFAQSTSVFVGGEIGWIDQPPQSTLTREQVSNEFLQFRKNPIAADGSRYVGGEIGWVLPQPDAHSAKPDPIMTPAERKRFEQDYPD